LTDKNYEEAYGLSVGTAVTLSDLERRNDCRHALSLQ